MDPEGLTASSPGDDAPVARWTAVAVHHKPLMFFLWASASALAALPMPLAWRAVWVALVTVAFALLVLTRVGTEARAEVIATRAHVIVRYRSGHVERLAFDALTEGFQVNDPHPRWVFRFGGDARLTLPDEADARPLIDAVRARLPQG